jgi:hypothetical protein
LKRLVERGSGIVRHLDGHDLKYGHELVQLLERQKGPGLAYFDHPLEAAIVITTIEVLKTHGKRNEDHLIQEKQTSILKARPEDTVYMSWLNYILTGVSIIAIIYSYAVGSATGVIIWAIVLGLNVALVLVERTKARKLM